VITLREKVINVIKRYEEQATAKKVVTASTKNIKSAGKDFNHESQA
jgi:hypothetical protein